MLQNIKALIVILAVALVIFAVAKPVCLRFTSAEDFARRRNVWLLLTTTAFLSPSFWIYVLVAVPAMAWAAKRDASPMALYLLLLFVIPPVEIAIPTVGIKQLFDLNQPRLMGLVILLPIAWRSLQTGLPDHAERRRSTVPDVLLIAYGVWQLILLMPHESVTNSARRGFLFFLDTWLVYYAFSRMGPHRRTLADAMSALCLSAIIFAPLAVFESNRQWLLYTGVAEAWGSANAFAWLFRGDALRAQVATGHAITLGYIIAMSIGCWFYLRSAQASKSVSAAVFGLLSVGLFYSYSRAPWVTAALLTLIFLALGSQNFAKLARAMLTIAVLGGIVAMTPVGREIIDNLPFIGTAEQGTVSYRQQLAETSWVLIQQHPFLGNPFVLLQMEDLRQGQGIIDLVNAYAAVALFYGLIGLAMFVGVYLAVLLKSHAQLKRARFEGDIDLALLGAALIACMLSTLVFMATVPGAWLQWMLAGMLASYAGLQLAAAPSPVAAEPAGRRGQRVASA